MQERGEFAYQVAQLKEMERSKVKQNPDSVLFSVGGVVVAIILVIASIYFNSSSSANGIKAGKTHIIIDLFQRLIFWMGLPFSIGIGVIVSVVLLYYAYSGLQMLSKR